MEETIIDSRKEGEVFSKRVRAGKRTYFFDVKTTRANDHYLTITESKRRPNKGGDGFVYEKHKIFLYKEDFKKFMDALNESVEFISEELGEDIESFARNDSYNNNNDNTDNTSTYESSSDLTWD